MSEQTQPVKELTVIQKNFKTVKEMIAGRMTEIKASLPHHVKADHFLRVYINSIQRNPALLECTPISLLGALLLCAQFGLEPDGLTRQAYLIPFNNSKKGVKEVQVIIGYGGLMDMARRSGKITGIEARVVREKDTFSYKFGIEPILTHSPYTQGDAGKPIFFYAIGRFDNGQAQFDVMDKAEVDKIRSRSRAKDSGPWVTDYEEMGKKTVLRRLCKLLPSSIELQRIITVDERGDLGMAQDLAVLADPEAQTTDEAVAQAEALMPSRASDASQPSESPNGANVHPAKAIIDKSIFEVLTMRYDGKCETCGGTLGKGTLYCYDRQNKKGYHHGTCPS